MARDRVLQRAFVGGEISPYLEQRADLQRWHSSLSIAERFVCMIQGGATRTSGTRDVLAALADSRLISFSFSSNDGYGIEFAPLKCRFFRDFGVLESAPGVPFELVTTYTAGDVAVLDYAQSADVLFVTCGTKTIRKITRQTALAWTIADLPVKLGPFMDENPEDGISISTDNAAATYPKGTALNLIASAPLFDALHVGALWKIAIKDRSKYKLWQPQFNVVVGDRRYWGENFYEATEISAGTDVKTGMVPPIHTYGEEWDGAGPNSNLGVKWKFLHSGWGVVKITGFTDTTHVAAVAETFVPKELFDGTWRWAEGAWSEYRGFPRVIAFHKKRLIAASTRAQPATGWASVLDDFPNFRNGTLATDGFTFTLQGGSNQVNQIEGLVSSGGRLWILTSGDEFCLPTSATREPITPSNFDIDNATGEGSAFVKPVKMETAVFVSKDKRRLHELGFDFAAESYIAPDLTVFADHITDPTIVELAWQREPYRLLWALRSDGVLACATYRKDQQVNAWHRHPIANQKKIAASGLLTLIGNAIHGQATQTLTFTGNAANNETVTIGARVYTWKAALTGAANEILIGANAAASIVNLVAALMGTAGAGAIYGNGTAKHVDIYAEDGAGDTIVVHARAAGAGGNAIATTETMANASWGAATLLGGAAAETVTLGSKAYTFRASVASLDAKYTVLVGAAATNTIDNLIAAIIAGAGVGATNGAGTVANEDVTAAAGAGDTMTVTALVAGSVGNLIVTSETMASGSFGGPMLSGGFDALGRVKSIAAAPSPTGIRQDLWMIVEYTLAAGVTRRVQSLMPFFERGNRDVRDAWFVDSGFEYKGAPVSTVTDIPAFMEGETVKIFADGKVRPPKLVTAGAVALEKAYSHIILGLGFTSKLKTLRYDRDLNGGTLAGKKSHVNAIVVDLLNAAGVKIASGDLAPEYIINEAGKVMDASAALMTGPTQRLPVDANWNQDGSVTIVSEDPVPATIRALTVEMGVSG